MPALPVEFETVTATLAEVLVAPVASRATAVNAWLPLADVAVFHENEYGALTSSVPRFAPSILNCMPATPLWSDAQAEITMLPETVAPGAGDVRNTVGGVVSGGDDPLMILTRVGGQGGAAEVPLTASTPPKIPVRTSQAATRRRDVEPGPGTHGWNAEAARGVPAKRGALPRPRRSGADGNRDLYLETVSG